MNDEPPPQLEGLVGQHARDGALRLSGSTEAIERLALAIERSSEGPWSLPAPQQASGAPFDGELRKLRIIGRRGRLSIRRVEDTMELAADEETRRLLARNLRALVVRGSTTDQERPRIFTWTIFPTTPWWSKVPMNWSSY